VTRKLSKEQLIAMRPCDLSDRLQLFGERNTLTVRQALRAGATISDLLWVAGQLGLGEKCALFAQRCADRAKTNAYAADAADAVAAEREQQRKDVIDIFG
jgi:hypothetical protein